jgi:hypothetical protein
MVQVLAPQGPFRHAYTLYILYQLVVFLNKILTVFFSLRSSLFFVSVLAVFCFHAKIDVKSRTYSTRGNYFAFYYFHFTKYVACHL